MFNIETFILRFQLKRALRLKAKLSEIEKRADLKTRFPEHQRYDLGGVVIVRFDADTGYDTARFLKDHPEVKTMLHTPAYKKPGRTERVSYKLAK